MSLDERNNKGVTLNIIVCVKQVLDPQIPPAKFKIDSEAKRVQPPEGIPPVINPYDAQAVELALRLKEKNTGKITVLTIGSEASATVVKHALSMGADEGFVLADKAFEGSDSFSTAYILTKAIQKIGSYDLVLCGRQAADWDEGLAGSLLAENLNLPLVTLAQSVEVNGKELKVKRGILEGYQFFQVTMPALVTVSNEIGQPRLPSGWGIISAARKKIPVWTATDIAAEPSQIGAGAARRKLVKLFSPARERKCEIITGETPAEAGAKLGEILRQKGVI
jgi:electron transfer flavoprotein beta subunit